MLDWLKSWLNSLVQWFFDWAQWIPKKIYSVAMDGIAKFLAALPVPDFMGQAGGAFAGLPASVVWFASSFQLSFGIKVILAALLARFILRRIPFIG